VLALVLASCGPTGRMARTGPKLPAKPLDCEINVALDGKLTKPYEIVGLVEAEGRDGVTELINVLSGQACLLGADAVTDIKEAVGSGYAQTAQISATSASAVGSTYTIYHLTATAVRYTP